MKLRFTLKRSGMKQLEAVYAARERRLGSALEGAVRTMADEAIAHIQGNINSFTPGRVPDLSPAYKDRKAQKFGHVYPILRASSEMYNSMFRRVYKEGTGHYRIHIGFSGERNRTIARAHLMGEGRVPQRDFMYLSQQFRDKWQRRIHAAMKGQ